jgi:nucleolar protein 9
MTTLLTNILKTLQPAIPTLLTNPHASPPVRLLFLTLIPDRPLPSLEAREGGLIRSKKSEKFRKGHRVQGTSIFGEPRGKGKGKGKVVQEVVEERKVPDELVRLRKEVRRSVMAAVQGVEWRSMGLDAVGSAAVQVSCPKAMNVQEDPQLTMNIAPTRR